MKKTILSTTAALFLGFASFAGIQSDKKADCCKEVKECCTTEAACCK